MIFDLHNDYPTVLPRGKMLEYAENLTDNGTTATAAVFTSELDAGMAMRTVTEVRGLLSDSRADIPLSVEDLGFLADGDIDTFDFCGLFYCSLTWNYDNVYAGGALDGGKLTDKGKKLIEAMNGKCAVDLAHLNRRSFFDALDCAQNPICSHTGFSEHPRCLNKAQISALARRHVPIGLSVVAKFSGAKSAREFAVVIDKYVQCYGCDNLCIGTDFNGSIDIPYDLSDYSMFATVVAELVAMGYTQRDCNKILYDNANRFYKEIVGERHI